MGIRVLLVDDHRMMRESLRTMLREESDIEVVGEAGEGRTALEIVKFLAPDVVVMDVAMKDLNGIDATRQIIHENSSVRVIALSTYSDRTFVRAMIEAGASGYVVKADAYEDLLRGIRAVAAGKKYLSSEVADVVVGGLQYPKRFQEAAQPVSLGEREREVLQLVAEGKSSKQVATALHISVKTVEAHRRNIMEKLDLHTVPDLTKYALRHGLIPLES